MQHWNSSRLPTTTSEEGQAQDSRWHQGLSVSHPIPRIQSQFSSIRIRLGPLLLHAYESGQGTMLPV